MGVLFFFFQAEDGIRDIGVTGVQTCALPISAKLGTALRLMDRIASRMKNPGLTGRPRGRGRRGGSWRRHPWRSEERRVGEDGRVPGAPDTYKNNIRV